ncbi:MAG: type II toxin-antitoxin system prevent-host-death family antitoxin [Alphaproteobacteria bacterium]|nr:type II toxin-antitoxin system prevent-host-death family antitoxin [Alphaproteobacteria bacterium]
MYTIIQSPSRVEEGRGGSAALACTRLRELVDRIETGEVIDILRRGVPVARLVPAQTQRQPDERRRSLPPTLPRLNGDAPHLVPSFRDRDRY